MIYICEFGFLLFSILFLLFQITLNIIHRVFTKPTNPIDVSPAKEYMDAKIITSISPTNPHTNVYL